MSKDLEGFFSYSAEGPWNKSLNFIFPTRYVMRKSLKVGHWLSEFLNKKLNSLTGPNLPKTGPNPNVGKWQTRFTHWAGNMEMLSGLEIFWANP